MAETASAQITVLSTSSPFVTGRKQSAPLQVSPTTLTLPQIDQNAANIANVFTPAGNLSLLSRPAASVLLTAQAGEKPKILEGHEKLRPAPHTNIAVKSNTNDFLGLTDTRHFVDNTLPPLGGNKDDFSTASNSLLQAASLSSVPAAATAGSVNVSA